MTPTAMSQGYASGTQPGVRLLLPNPVRGSRAGPGAITLNGSHGFITLTGCSTASATQDVTTVVTNNYVTAQSLVKVHNCTGATIAVTSNPSISTYGAPSAGSFTIRIFNSGAVAFNNGGAAGDLLIEFEVINPV
jgi:hypothetical protein